MFAIIVLAAMAGQIGVTATFLELNDAGRPAAGSWVAIHETKRVRDEADCYTWLTDRRPDVDIPGHIELGRTIRTDGAACRVAPAGSDRRPPRGA